ncbi:hypothetical protein GCM10027612_25080 [Microbispora bryophytorum subsp. camponoti]
MPQERGAGPGVDERVVMTVERDVGHGAAGRERAGSLREIPDRLGHGADTEVTAERGGRAETGELLRDEAEIEGEVVRDRHTSAQEFDDGPGDVCECGRVPYVGGADSVNALRTEIALRVDERRPLAGHLTRGRDVDDSDLDDTIMPSG